MKLYTEEQVRIIVGKARIHNQDDSEMFTDDYLIEEQTPIELPNQLYLDERLFSRSDEYAYGYITAIEHIEEQIQGGNK